MAHRHTPLALLFAASCAGQVAPSSSSQPRPCDDAHPVTLASAAFDQGRLLRARAILEGSAPDDRRCVDPRRAALGATITRELGDPATLDPFAEIDAARAGSDPIAAQKSWARAAHALATQTGKEGRPLWLRDPLRESESIATAAPVPLSMAKRVVYARRSASGPVEPVRLVDAATVLAGGELLTESAGTVRRMVASALSDPAVAGIGTVDFASRAASSYAVACDRGGLHVYDDRSQTVVGDAARPCPSKMIVASDERLVTIGETLAVLELPSLRVLAELPRESFVESFALSADGSTFAAIDGGRQDDRVKLLVFDVRRGKALPTIPHSQAGRLRLALSPKGKKLLVVDEAAEVFDLETKRRTPLGGRVFHPFRPGAYDRFGWGDLVTPPVGTGAIAVMDDGRACIEQGGTAAIVPRSASEVCSIDAGGGARLGRVAATSSATAWSPPPPLTDRSQRTILVDEPSALVFRVEQALEKAATAQVVVAYDRSTGRERRRFPVAQAGAIALEGVSADGRSLHLRLGGSAQESGFAYRVDLETGLVTQVKAPEAPSEWRYLSKIEDGKLVLFESPSSLYWFWDLHDLRRFGVDEPSFGAISAVPSLTFKVDASDLIQVTQESAGPTPIATIAPMRRGLAVFWQSGSLELVSVSDPPDDLVCVYGDLVVPLRACGERLVEGRWRERFGR